MKDEPKYFKKLDGPFFHCSQKAHFLKAVHLFHTITCVSLPSRSISLICQTTYSMNMRAKLNSQVSYLPLILHPINRPITVQKSSEIVPKSRSSTLSI